MLGLYLTSRLLIALLVGHWLLSRLDDSKIIPQIRRTHVCAKLCQRRLDDFLLCVRPRYDVGATSLCYLGTIATLLIGRRTKDSHMLQPLWQIIYLKDSKPIVALSATNSQTWQLVKLLNPNWVPSQWMETAMT